MIGLFAIQGDRVYFNEALLKGNFTPCQFPLENWFIPKKRQLFIPLNAAAVGVLDVLGDEKYAPPKDVQVPTLAGILICPDMRLYEVGMTDAGELAMKRIPVMMTNNLVARIGVRYVRSQQRDLEEAFMAAMRITDDLEKANELMTRSTLSLPGKPVYTRLQQLIWGAITQDAKLIRSKMTNHQLRMHVKNTAAKVHAKAEKQVKEAK